MTFRRSLLYTGFGLLFVAASFAAFGHALTQGFAPIDDAFLVVNNLAIRGIGWEQLKTIFTTYDPELYIPLTFLSFQIDYLIGGLDPFVFHTTNVLLHAVNAMLVACLLRLLTRTTVPALIGGLLFAIHPLHTEAVVWIAGRKDLLSTMFFLLAFIAYIRQSERTARMTALCLGCFVLALLSKVTALTLPVVLILYDALLRERKFDRKFLIDIAPFAALSAVFLAVAIAGKTRVLAAATPWETILIATKSTAFYAWKFIAPGGLTFLHPHSGPVALFSTDIFPSVIAVMAMLAAAVIAFRKDKRWISFGILFFLVTVLPTFSNIAKAGVLYFAVERYAYIPSIGLLFIVASALGGIIRDDSVRVALRPWIAVPSITLIVIFCLLSMRQTRTWDSAETLYHQALAVHPESVTARSGLARLYRESGRHQDAFDVLKDGLPYGDHVLLRLGAGTIYAATGQVADAREQFEIAMAMDPENPEPAFYLGSLEEQTDAPDRARILFEQAIALDDSYVAAHTRLGTLYLDEQRVDDAAEQFAVALRWNPNATDAHIGMARVLVAGAENAAARIHLQKALELEPGNAEAQAALQALDNGS